MSARAMMLKHCDSPNSCGNASCRSACMKLCFTLPWNRMFDWPSTNSSMMLANERVGSL